MRRISLVLLALTCFSAFATPESDRLHAKAQADIDQAVTQFVRNFFASSVPIERDMRMEMRLSGERFYLEGIKSADGQKSCQVGRDEMQKRLAVDMQGIIKKNEANLETSASYKSEAPLLKSNLDAMSNALLDYFTAGCLEYER